MISRVINLINFHFNKSQWSPNLAVNRSEWSEWSPKPLLRPVLHHVHTDPYADRIQLLLTASALCASGAPSADEGKAYTIWFTRDPIPVQVNFWTEPTQTGPVSPNLSVLRFTQTLVLYYISMFPTQWSGLFYYLKTIRSQNRTSK